MRSCGYLFERLQKRVGCLSIHFVGIVNDKDARLALMRAKVGFAFDLARLINLDEVFLSPNQSDIPVLTPNDVLGILQFVVGSLSEMSDADARRTMVTGFDADGRETVQGFGEFEREKFFADRRFAREEQRAGHAASGEHAAQGLLCALISDEAIKHTDSR